MYIYIYIDTLRYQQDSENYLESFQQGIVHLGLKLKKKPASFPVLVYYGEKWKLLLEEADK